MPPVSRYLIYALLDTRPGKEGEVRYVGKSSSGLKRARRHNCEFNQRDDGHLPVYRWIQKLKSLGLTYEIQILEERDAFSDLGWHETKHIAHQRMLGARLLNCTDGGEGSTGAIASLEHRSKIRAANLGRRDDRSRRISNSRAQGGGSFVDQNGTRYETLRDAAIALDLDYSSVSKVLRGSRKSCGGYIFRRIHE